MFENIFDFTKKTLIYLIRQNKAILYFDFTRKTAKIVWVWKKIVKLKLLAALIPRENLPKFN